MRDSLGAAKPAVDEAAEGIDGEFQLGADETLAQARLGEDEARFGREPAAVENRDVKAVQAVAGALGLTAVFEGDDGSVAGAQQFLQLPSASLMLRAGDSARAARSASSSSSPALVRETAARCGERRRRRRRRGWRASSACIAVVTSSQ